MTIESPRLLTKSEINEIVSVITSPSSLLDQIQVSALKSLQKSLKNQLATIKLVPDGIPSLKEKFLEQYQDSQSISGTPVGMTAGEAFGGPLTQTTLNTFKKAGSATNISGGISAFQELLEVKQKRENKATIIAFNQFLTFNEIFKIKQNQFVELYIGDLILDYEIGPPAQMFPEGRPLWYSWYQELFRTTIPETTLLRLKLNVNKMYFAGLLPEDVYNNIMNYSYQNFKIKAIFSPILLEKDIVDVTRDNKTETIETLVPRIYLDIYLKSSQISSKTIAREVSDIHVLRNLVLPSLEKNLITGIPHIKSLIPQSIPIWSAILAQDFLEDQKWILWLNKIVMKTKSIYLDLIIKLLRQINLKIIETDQERIIVEISKDAPKNSPKEIWFYYDNIINEEKTKYEIDKLKEFENLYSEDPTKAIRLNLEWPISPIYQAAYKNISITSGHNLYTILQRDDVDVNFTYSNNYYEVLANFGIEAARNLLFLELSETISATGSYIDPRHIVLIVDFMTFNGNLKPLTLVGMEQQPTGALSIASLEYPFKIITPTAVFGASESMSSVSGSLFVGKKIPTGTGYNQSMMEINPEIEAEYEEMLKKGITITENQINDELNSLDFGFPINLVEEPEIIKSEIKDETPIPVIISPKPLETLLEATPKPISQVSSNSLTTALDKIPLPVCEPASDEIPFDISAEAPNGHLEDLPPKPFEEQEVTVSITEPRLSPNLPLWVAISAAFERLRLPPKLRK